MPSLIINPPRDNSAIPPLPASEKVSNDSISRHTAEEVPPSPVAPDYSPITPKAQPALPATYLSQNSQQVIPGGNDYGQPAQSIHSIAQPSHPPTAEFLPEPAPRPFSDEDAPDAIALRAAISSLQFQKKKAQDDIRALEKIKKKALDEPELFKTELAAGRLQEQKPKIADLQAILDHEGSDDDDDEVVLGASAGDGDTEMTPAGAPDMKPAFDRIPGPQNVVRMPYINWDKYNIAGSPLDAMHEQQRRWPGTAYGLEKGREHTVAAPYSPWMDSLDGQGQQQWGRNDSMAATTPTTAVTPTTTVSEHPMETRKRNNQ